MGWWQTADGTGVVGDGPADAFKSALVDSLGERYDADLYAGFLAALGAALLRNPEELVADPPRPGTPLVAHLSSGEPLVVPISPAAEPGGLQDALFDTLESVAFEYRIGGPERLPRLSELLETLSFVTRGLTGDDGETALDVIRIGTYTAEDVAREAADPDWRARMMLLLIVGRLGLGGLARHARAVEIPPPSAGLREDDRRALMALRDVAAARAEGVPLERPVHPDPEIAARRARLLEDVEAAVAGTALPEPGSPAFVLRALLEPDVVRASGAAPPEWRGWLAEPA